VDWLDRREVPFTAGWVLVAIGIGVTFVTHDSAVSLVIVLAGCVLILYAVIWDRLESFGPSGVKLFQRIREDVARTLEKRGHSNTIPGRSEEVGDKVKPSFGGDRTDPINAENRMAPAEAAALVRRAETPDELVDSLVRIALAEPIQVPEDRPHEP